MSLASSASSRVSAEKWNAAGKSTAMTLIVKSEAFTCVAPGKKMWSEREPHAQRLQPTDTKSLFRVAQASSEETHAENEN